MTINAARGGAGASQCHQADWRPTLPDGRGELGVEPTGGLREPHEHGGRLVGLRAGEPAVDARRDGDHSRGSGLEACRMAATNATALGSRRTRIHKGRCRRALGIAVCLHALGIAAAKPWLTKMLVGHHEHYQHYCCMRMPGPGHTIPTYALYSGPKHTVNSGYMDNQWSGI